MQLLISDIVGQTVHFTIHVDNTAAIAQIRQGEDAGWKNRHVSIRAFAVVVAIRNGEASIDYCETANMAADGLTKGVGPQVLHRMCDLWGLVNVW